MKAGCLSDSIDVVHREKPNRFLDAIVAEKTVFNMFSHKWQEKNDKEKLLWFEQKNYRYARIKSDK